MRSTSSQCPLTHGQLQGVTPQRCRQLQLLQLSQRLVQGLGAAADSICQGQQPACSRYRYKLQVTELGRHQGPSIRGGEGDSMRMGVERACNSCLSH
jgi:hypothetical protein